MRLTSTQYIETQERHRLNSLTLWVVCYVRRSSFISILTQPTALIRLYNVFVSPKRTSRGKGFGRVLFLFALTQRVHCNNNIRPFLSFVISFVLREVLGESRLFRLHLPAMPHEKYAILHTVRVRSSHLTFEQNNTDLPRNVACSFSFYYYYRLNFENGSRIKLSTRWKYKLLFFSNKTGISYIVKNKIWSKAEKEHFQTVQLLDSHQHFWLYIYIF